MTQTYLLAGKDRIGVRWLEAPLIAFTDLKVVTTVADFDVMALFQLLEPDWVVVDYRLPQLFKEDFKLLVTSSDAIYAEVGIPDPNPIHPYLCGPLWAIRIEGIEEIQDSID